MFKLSYDDERIKRFALVVQGGAPNYFPNSFGGPQITESAAPSDFTVSPDVKHYNSADKDNFSQATLFWQKVLKADERQRLASNIAGHLKGAQGFIQERVIKQFSHVHPELGRMIRHDLEAYRNYRPTSNL